MFTEKIDLVEGRIDPVIVREFNNHLATCDGASPAKLGRRGGNRTRVCAFRAPDLYQLVETSPPSVRSGTASLLTETIDQPSSCKQVGG